MPAGLIRTRERMGQSVSGLLRSAFNWAAVLVFLGFVGMAIYGAAFGLGPEPSSIDERVVEDQLHQQLNDERERSGMQTLPQNDRLQRVAREHADDMADRDFYGHTNPDGVTQEQRYAFCDGGENIAQTMVFERVRLPDGPVVEYESEEELSEGVFGQWMNSDPHRDRGIHGEWWRAAGVGVAVTDEGDVYAVMAFCSR